MQQERCRQAQLRDAQQRAQCPERERQVERAPLARRQLDELWARPDEAWAKRAQP